MIGELVEFRVSEGVTAEQVMEEARASLRRWQGWPKLIRKHYLYNDDGSCGGFYLWENKEAAKEAHNKEWQDQVELRTGSRPTFKYFTVNMLLDNVADTVVENP